MRLLKGGQPKLGTLQGGCLLPNSLPDCELLWAAPRPCLFLTGGRWRRAHRAKRQLWWFCRSALLPSHYLWQVSLVSEHVFPVRGLIIPCGMLGPQAQRVLVLMTDGTGVTCGFLSLCPSTHPPIYLSYLSLVALSPSLKIYFKNINQT